MKIASLRERTAKSTLAFRIVCYNERERTKAAKLFFYADFTQNTHNCELSIYDEIKKTFIARRFSFFLPFRFQFNVSLIVLFSSFCSFHSALLFSGIFCSRYFIAVANPFLFLWRTFLNTISAHNKILLNVSECAYYERQQSSRCSLGWSFWLYSVGTWFGTAAFVDCICVCRLSVRAGVNFQCHMLTHTSIHVDVVVLSF